MGVRGRRGVRVRSTTASTVEGPYRQRLMLSRDSLGVKQSCNLRGAIMKLQRSGQQRMGGWR